MVERSEGEVACIQREVLLRQVSAHLTNGAVSTVSTQYLLYLPRLGPDFVIFIVPRPGGHQAGLGWAGLADWAGIIWTKKLKYARIYILQWPGPAQLTVVGGGN